MWGRTWQNSLWEDHLLKGGKDVLVVNQLKFIKDREGKILKLKSLLIKILI